MMDRCCACGKAGESSDEHVIWQALGGRLTARVLCKRCNSETGDTIDKALVKELAPLAALLDTRRERNKHQQIRVTRAETGEEFLIGSRTAQRAKPEVPTDDEMIKTGEGLIRARSDQELDSILEGKKRRLDFSNATTERISGDKELGLVCLEPIVIGQRDMLRAVGKAAYCFLASQCQCPDRLMADCFQPIRRYVFQDMGPGLAVSDYEHTWFLDHVVPGNETVPAHAIVIHFDGRRRNIVGYVQLFGVFRFGVLLACGNPWSMSILDLLHHVNPLTGSHVERSLNVTLPDVQSGELLRARPLDVGAQRRIAELCGRACGSFFEARGGGRSSPGVVFLDPAGIGAVWS